MCARAHTGLRKLIPPISSQLHIQRYHSSIWNLAIVRLFILWESADATEGFLGSGRNKHLQILASTPLGICLIGTEAQSLLLTVASEDRNCVVIPDMSWPWEMFPLFFQQSGHLGLKLMLWNRDTDIENKCMDTQGEKEGGWMNWEIGNDVYTPLILCIKQTYNS